MLEGVLDLPAIQVREIMTLLSATCRHHPAPKLARHHVALYGNRPLALSRIYRWQQRHGNGYLYLKDFNSIFGRQGTQGQNIDHFNLEAMYASQFISVKLRLTTCCVFSKPNSYGNRHWWVWWQQAWWRWKTSSEEIVGDIIDEHDDIEEDTDINHIVPVPTSLTHGLCNPSPVSDCNEQLGHPFW